MKVSPGNAQHQGDRGEQQDSFGFSTLADRRLRAHGGVMMVLCDGMGGLANGAAAAHAAVAAMVQRHARKAPDEPIAATIEAAFADAQRAVRRLASDDVAVGTTGVVAIVLGRTLHWGAAGDSRLYLCRGTDPARQLTTDHNVASDPRIRSSRYDIPEALTRFIGSPEPLEIDQGMEPLADGHRVMACSDGVYAGLSADRLAAAGRGLDPMAAAGELVATVVAMRRPHQDNLTVTMLDVADDGWLEALGGRRTLAIGGSAVLAAALVGVAIPQLTRGTQAEPAPASAPRRAEPPRPPMGQVPPVVAPPVIPPPPPATSNPTPRSSAVERPPSERIAKVGSTPLPASRRSKVRTRKKTSPPTLAGKRTAPAKPAKKDAVARREAPPTAAPKPSTVSSPRPAAAPGRRTGPRD